MNYTKIKKKSNPCIGVIAPANTMADMDPDLVDLAVQRFAGWGIKVKFGKHACKRDMHCTGTIEQRLEDWNWAVNDEEISIIMPIYGGYNSNHLLDGIDYDQFRDKSKLLIGFSDISALIAGIHTKAGMITAHGPSFAIFTDPNVFAETTDNFFQVIQGETEIVLRDPGFFADDDWFLKEGFGPREIEHGEFWKTYRKGTCEGMLVGGNLQTLLALAGTPYFPKMDGAIFFTEDVVKAPVLDRQFTQLRQMGIFDKISGLIIGKSPRTADVKSDALVHILDKHLGYYNFPVVYGFHCSHVDPIFTLPLGVSAEMRTDPEITLTITEKIYR